MYEIKYTNRMKKDLKLIRKQGKNLEKLIDILDLLAMGETLPEKNKDHQLQGEYREFRECHIEPDWLLIYRIDEGQLLLLATATGSHSYLFNK